MGLLVRARHLAHYATLALIAFTGCRSVQTGTVSVEAEIPTKATVERVVYETGEDSAETPATVDLTDVAVPASAERGWTLAELEQLALENHPATEVAAAAIVAADGGWEQAGLKPNPTIGYHATQIGNRDTTGQQGAYVAQRFITAGKLDLDQSVAAWGVQQSRDRFDIARRRVLNNVRLRFYDALVARRRLELTDELVRVGDALAASSRKLLEARQASENDVLQAEIEAENARILADNARNQNVEALKRLAVAVGRDALPNETLAGQLEDALPELKKEESLARILGASPELDVARSRVQQARWAIVRAEREWIPNVDAFVSARHNTINPQHDNVVNVQVGIPLPVFDRNQGNIRKAHAEWVAAEHAVRRIELDLRDRFEVAFRRYANARQQVDRYSKRILPRSRKSLDLVKGGYEKRQVDYLTLLTTQRTYYRTSLALLDAVWELRRAAIEIEGCAFPTLRGPIGRTLNRRPRSNAGRPRVRKAATAMFSNFINPLLLSGVALGVALPVLVHLLSKRKFDVVEWGAMQFLEIGRNARRKLRLEQLLLMLLRMALIALLAIALARPWIEGGWFLQNISKQPRDVVLIVDGSYSMGWSEKSSTPHSQAVKFAQRFVADLRAGDNVALIDARDQARLVIETPTSDLARVRRELNDLPPPSGTSNLADAMNKAVQILSSTSNLSREIVVFTDGQAKGWQPDDKGLWALYDKMLDEPSVKPRTWVVEVGPQNTAKRTNFAVENLQLSRELTSVGYPVKIKTKVRLSSGRQTIPRKVFFEVDGQRLAEQTRPITISADREDREESIEFEHRFATAGSHLVSVVIENDNLPGDNRADASVTITEAVPILLVDGDPHPGEPVIKSETVFAVAALSPEENPAPWVKAEVVSWKNLDAKLKTLSSYEAVFLANVPRFTDGQIQALSTYANQGGGLFFALGDQVDKTHYNMKLYNKGAGLLPVSLESIEVNKDNTKKVVQVEPASLELSWMQPFKTEGTARFTTARFSHRWKTTVADDAPPAANAKGGPKAAAGKNGAADVDVSLAPMVVARLNTGDPFLVSRKQGRGHSMVMAVPIDGDWGTLQGTSDYTPFLHEIVFFLASSKASRNVPSGVPLVLRVPEDADVSRHVFFGPGNTKFPFAEGVKENGQKTLRLNDTSLPGVYQFRRKNDKDELDLTSPPEYFVVNFDRGESDLTQLSEENREALIDNGDIEGDRLAFYREREALTQEMFKDSSRAELWRYLMLFFLVILVFEVVMTRKMVQGGHVMIDDDEEPIEDYGEPVSASPPPIPPGRRRGGDSDEPFFWVAIVAAVIAVVLIVMLLRYEWRLVPRKVGVTLLTMRMIVVLLLIFVFLQPVLSWTLESAVSGRIIVAVDLSESMATTDQHAQNAEKLRWARALGMIGNAKTNDRIDRWIAAYEEGKEPPWVDKTEGGSVLQKQKLAETRKENAEKVFAAVDAISRKEIAKRLLLKGSDPLLAKLQKLGDVDVVVFGGKVVSADDESLEKTVDEPPNSLRADVSNLTSALMPASSSKIAGVVLLTDGRDNADLKESDVVSAAKRLGQNDIPVFPVRLGSILKPSDLSFGKLTYPEKARREKLATLTAKVNTRGFENRELTVVLKRKGGEAVEKKITPKGPETTVKFDLDTKKIGRYEYTITTPVQEGETWKTNNSKTFPMTVVAEKVRALLVEGEARWEFRFIDNALSRDDTMEMKRVVFQQPYLGILQQGFFPRKLKLPAKPDDLEDSPFAEPDLVILGDVDENDLTAKGWQLLERFVGEAGGTLVMIAGKEYFPLSHKSPIVAAMLPVTNLKPRVVVGRQAEASPTERGFHLRLTPEGAREPMFQFEDDSIKNRSAWANLPGHTWGLLGEAKKGATVYAYAVEGGKQQTLEEQRRSAVIVQHQYGFGQVLWIGIDSTWRWRHRVGDKYHHRFWGQVGLWGASKIATAGNKFVEFGPENSDIEFGDDAVIRARWSKQFLERHPNLKATIQVFRSDDEQRKQPFATLPMVPDKSRPLVYVARAISLPAGAYKIRLAVEGASIGNEPLETDLFVKERVSLELQDPSANRPLLQQIADESRGKLLELDEIGKLPALLRKTDDSRSQNPETRLWDNWVVMLLFIGILVIEWVVRKLNGLP
eukprot:g26605.t1